MNKSILITGANAGLGKETARQLALISGTEKVYLACRNKDRAIAAKKELEDATGKDIFEIVLMDVTDLNSVKTAVESIKEPIDALIMNAGGMGGKTPNAKTENGVTHIFASNVLGHIVLLDELIKANKLTNVALFAGSEAVRGIKAMGMKAVNLNTSSVDEFASICDGSFFKENVDPMISYGPVKYVAIMSLLSTARKNPNIRIFAMSPGGTSGTNAANDMSGFMKVLMTVMSTTLMPLMGIMHSLATGAKRYVDGITEDSYESGVFYASKKNGPTGPVNDQSIVLPDLKNTLFQDNANEAVHRFVN